MEFKLGKLPPVTDVRTLRFMSYVSPQLPAPPLKVDYAAKVPSWPMYANDKYGDCTCAAAGHMIQAWTANAGKEVSPSGDSVLRFYEHFVGDPPPPDEGCNMLEVLRYWRKSGLADHKVRAFTKLENGSDLQARQALFMFGAVYIGVALPDSVVPKGVDPRTVPWEVPAGGPVGAAAPDPNNGHCIPAVGYDADHLYVVTWAALKSMSWAFYDAYCDESYAVLSDDFMAKNGKNAAGFDLDTLTRDLAGL